MQEGLGYKNESRQLLLGFVEIFQMVASQILRKYGRQKAEKTIFIIERFQSEYKLIPAGSLMGVGKHGMPQNQKTGYKKW